jgi:hypothetical protein
MIRNHITLADPTARPGLAGEVDLRHIPELLGG